MPFDLALADLYRPYLLRGETTPWHAVLSVIYVESYETATGPSGTVIRGVARFSGDVDLPTFDPATGTLTAGAANTEGHPRNQPDRTEPWLDITDTRVEFAMTVPRAAGAIISAGVGTIPGGELAFQPVRDVLDALDAPPIDPPPSDYPGTGFTLDMVLAGIELRPPFLQPAEMRPDCLLVPHSSRRDVVFHLPKLKIRLFQGVDAGAQLQVCLLSLGAQGLDDPGALGAAELVTMEPAHAFIGPGRIVGFGFRSAYLDLADGYTPPEVLSQFGFDEAWTGLYLPEIRIFFAPNGAEDFAVNAGVENLLIGIGGSSGLTGDFDVAVINQGSGDLVIGANFFTSEGRGIGILRETDTTARAALPEMTRMAVDVRGGRAPYSVTVDQGSGAQAGVLHDVTTPATGELTITITATDTSAPQKMATLTITAGRRAPPAQIPPAGEPLPATLITTSITRDGQPIPAPPLRLLNDNRSGGQVRVDLALPSTPAGTQWRIDGATPVSGASIDIPLVGGETKAIEASVPGRIITELPAYFRFDTPPKPDPPLADPIAYSRIPGNIRDAEAVETTAASPTSGWTPGAQALEVGARDILSRIPAGAISVEGTASFDGDTAKAQYNWLLSQRRAAGLKALLNDHFGPFGGAEEPIGPTVTATWSMQWQTQGPMNRAQYWRADITGFSVTLPGEVITGEVSRPMVMPPPPPPMVTDEPPTDPQPPDWFRSARLKVRIVRDQFVALELSGEVDFQTGVESALAEGGASAGQMPGDIRGLGQNPADGITDFLFLYQTDPASQSDEVKLYIGADPADKDGLVMTGALPNQAPAAKNFGRDLLGMTTIFTPLLAEIAPANPADGGIAPIAVSAAVIGTATGLASAGFFTVERVILFGGEGAFRRQGDLWQVSFLFDVETAVSMNIELGGTTLIEVPRNTPLAVRYKAIGLSFGQPPGGGGAWEFRPVFDQSKGYSIDLSGPGSLRVVDPIGQVLQVLGARIARTNPMTFEIDLGFSVDLGVISVERARIRLPVSPLGPPELTAFGAGLKVPGVIEGTGYMEMTNGTGGAGIKGGIDVRLIPVKLRIAAQIAIEPISAEQGGPATAFAIALEVELPVAIPLAQSGFGIYGFIGLFAMHYTRNEDGITSLTPALVWLRDRANGDPTDLQAWRTELDAWAFGAGITLGTMGSPIIFNVKGMFLLDLPGPRVLLVVRANLLAVLPALKDKNAEGTFLCVIDLDFGRGTLTIGISIDFKIDPIVEIQIPIEAFFDLEDGEFWHVYLGSFPGNDLQGNPLPGPIRASILGVFDGSGYVMLSGHGIPGYQPPGQGLPALSQVNGFGIAVGLEVSIIWGNTSINLYLKVTAGFNAILGFEPFYVGGQLYLRGELKLFIISLSASAALVAQIGERADGQEVSRIDGEVCGKIDLFFFEIEGCVDFHIGEDDKILPPPPDPFAGAVLVSRSPALAEGTGVDRGIDSKIGDMVRAASAPAADAMPVVPIDAVPVLSFDFTPLDGGITVMGSTPGGATGANAGGFVARGDFAYRFTMEEVTLERVGEADGVLPGNTPSTWWTLEPVEGENLTTHLSLLNWVPNPTPKALERTEILEETVRDRWGTTCQDAAPAACILWTFHDERLGPSPTGWNLDGVAWPDPPETKRSVPPDTDLHVHETWRTGITALDRLRGIVPAIIEGGLVRCAPDRTDDDRPDRSIGDVFVATRPPLDPADPDTVPDGFALDTTRPALDPAAGIAATESPSTFGIDRRTGDRIADAEARAGEPVSTAFTDATRRLAAARLSATRERLAPATGGVPTPEDISLGTGTLSASAPATGDAATLLAARTARAARTMERDRLVAATAGSFGTAAPADMLTADVLALGEATRRIELGLPLARSALFSAASGLVEFVGTGPATAAPPNDPDGPADDPDGPRCAGRVLASPLWDTGRPVVFGDTSLADAVADELAEIGHKHGPMSDVIEVDSGQIVGGHLLMWVNRGLLNDDTGSERGIVIHHLDDDGTVLDVRPVRVSDLLPVTSLPPRWIDPDGPWFEDVYHAVLYGQSRLSPRQPVCVKLEPPKEATRFRIGVLYLDEKQAQRFEQQGRPFYVGAIEMTRLSEVERHDFDESEIEKDRKVLEDFLGPASGNVALLYPGSTYRLRARAAVRTRDDEGAETDGPDQEAVFWFRTDDAAPARLDPWVLCTLPGEGARHVFGGDNPRVVFNTNAVDTLFAAYGRELRARLKASSFAQVDEPSVPHPFPIGPATLEDVEAHVLSPFEAVLSEVVTESLPCVPVDEDRVRHSMVTLPIPLEPYTDYLLDIESVPLGAAADTVGDRVYRVAFSTGRFGSVEAFGLDMQATLTEHRAVAPGVMQAIGADPRFAARDPEGAEFDHALIDAGLEPMEVPGAARLVIFWEQANPAATPQPAAMLIDAPEPMHRTRPQPQEVHETDPDGIAGSRWKLVETTWLELVESAASDGLVDRILYAPGRQRALVTLTPGARGQVLKLDLVRTAFPEPYLDEGFASDVRIEVVSEMFDRAPWEES